MVLSIWFLAIPVLFNIVKSSRIKNPKLKYVYFSLLCKTVSFF